MSWDEFGKGLNVFLWKKNNTQNAPDSPQVVQQDHNEFAALRKTEAVLKNWKNLLFSVDTTSWNFKSSCREIIAHSHQVEMLEKQLQTFSFSELNSQGTDVSLYEQERVTALRKVQKTKENLNSALSEVYLRLKSELNQLYPLLFGSASIKDIQQAATKYQYFEPRSSQFVENGISFQQRSFWLTDKDYLLLTFVDKWLEMNEFSQLDASKWPPFSELSPLYIFEEVHKLKAGLNAAFGGREDTKNMPALVLMNKVGEIVISETRHLVDEDQMKDVEARAAADLKVAEQKNLVSSIDSCRSVAEMDQAIDTLVSKGLVWNLPAGMTFLDERAVAETGILEERSQVVLNSEPLNVSLIREAFIKGLERIATNLEVDVTLRPSSNIPGIGDVEYNLAVGDPVGFTEHRSEHGSALEISRMKYQVDAALQPLRDLVTKVKGLALAEEKMPRERYAHQLEMILLQAEQTVWQKISAKRMDN